jgi:hypothetical protein
VGVVRVLGSKTVDPTRQAIGTPKSNSVAKDPRVVGTPKSSSVTEGHKHFQLGFEL